MDVRPGHKQTEIGVIAEDWDATAMGTMFTFKNGLNKSKEYFGYGTPIVNYMDVFNHSGLKLSDLEGRVDVNKQELKAYEVRQGDVFFTRTSETVEEIGVASVMLDAPGKTVFSGFVLRGRPIDDSLDNEFKRYCFSSRVVRQQITSKSSYTTRALTNGRALSAVIIPTPPRVEQRAIAAALRDADALIESLEQLITKKRHLKQGARQELLRPKDGWVNKKLGNLGAFLKGSGVRKDEATSGELLCIRYGEIYTKHNDYVKGFHSWISKEVAATARRLRAGDLLFAGSGETREEIGKCVAFVDDFEAYAGGDIVILRPENANSIFMGYYLNTGPINRQKTSKGQGDAIVHISASALADIDIAIPGFDEQTAIATILSDMDAEIAALETKLAKIRQIKQGMMHNLLTGRIRLV